LMQRATADLASPEPRLGRLAYSLPPLPLAGETYAPLGRRLATRNQGYR
jgi:hypothetical protein